MSLMSIKTLPNNCVPPHSHSWGILDGKIIHDGLQEVRERNCWCPYTCRSYRKPRIWTFTGNRISRVGRPNASWNTPISSGYVQQIHRLHTQRYAKGLLRLASPSSWCRLLSFRLINNGLQMLICISLSVLSWYCGLIFMWVRARLLGLSPI